jgi:serine/threonine protein kinase
MSHAPGSAGARSHPAVASLSMRFERERYVQLSKDQFAVLSELLDEGLDLPEASRGSWVAGLSEPFAGAKAILRKMLAYEAGGEAQDFLNTLPKFPAPGDAAPDPHETGLQPGARIGVYILIREIGQGGMSTVWLARRTDELVKRPVALKLPHLHLQSARFAERFARERDILANLTHPHIAHLYDAGITSEGQPFLAMEFVAGEPLTQYCTAHQLGIVERLQLFLQVLEAVDYAHAQGVIHRDLKPSNILVREGGEVVLLDFGIAKLLVDGQSEQTELTLHAGAALTPHYASPEQIRGDSLGPATDVYSLGVLLYELLSGQRPYELTGSTRRALEEAILSTDPRRPSEVATQRSRTGETAPRELVRNRLRGDLDIIVLKALKKPSAERYLTAAAFAEDLRRYLRGDTVSARPDTFWYRLTKRARRHRPALQGAAVAGLAIAAVAAAVISALEGGWMSNRHASAVTARPVGAEPASLTTTINPRSIAVLPFLDLSENKDQEYFSDGMTEQLINELAQLSSLRVSARTSSFYFKGKQSTVAEISKLLHVTAVVEGSVRRVGNQVRITVQLVDAGSGFHVWSHVYDRGLKDILEVQSSVATSIAQALNVTLTPDDWAKFALGGTQNPAAFDMYLRAEQQLRTGIDSEAGTRAALALFDQAIALDPNYAYAYTGRARSLDVLAVFHVDAATRDDVRRQALAAGERAVALAPQLGEAHATLAITRAYGLLDFAGAAPDFDRAIALSPGNARVQRLYAEFSSALGHREKAIAAAKRAVSLDPQNLLSHVTLGRALLHSRNYRDALLAFHDAEALKSDSNYLQGNIVAALVTSGQVEQARQRCESKTISLNDDNRHYCLALAYHLLGNQPTAERELAQLKALAGDEAAFGYAAIYAQWGDANTALAWLAKAEQRRDPSLQSLRVAPLLDPLRKYPEFHAIEERLKLPP